MFEFLRKHSKVVMWVVLVFVGAPFVFFYGVSDQMGKGREIAFEVYGHEVSAAEFRAEKSMIYMFNPESGRDMDQLEGQARARLTFYYKARNAGVKASDDMVRNFIVKFPFFLDNGRFNKKRYKLMLDRHRMTTASFEEGVRRILTIQTFSELLNGSVRVGDDDVRNDYIRKNQKADLLSVTVASKDFADKVTIADDDIQNYYATNKKSFERDAEIKIEYVLAWASDYEAAVTIAEEDIKKQYENTKERYANPAKEGEEKTYKSYSEVRGEIESQLKKSESEKLSRKAVSELREKLTAKDADWNALAKQGNVIHKVSPFFSQRQMLSQEFGWSREIDFNAAEDKISSVIRTMNFQANLKVGQLVYRVLAKKDAVVPALDEIREDVKKKLTIDKAKELANFAMQANQKSLAEGDFNAVAIEKGLKVVEHTAVTFDSLGVDGDRLYALKDGAISAVMSQPARPQSGLAATYRVFKLLKRTSIDEEEFSKKKEEIKRSLTNTKRSQFQQALGLEIEQENRKLP